MNENLKWNIIQKYFEDNPKCLVKHQIDSFNDFFNYNIKQIFKEKVFRGCQLLPGILPFPPLSPPPPLSLLARPRACQIPLGTGTHFCKRLFFFLFLFSFPFLFCFLFFTSNFILFYFVFINFIKLR